LGLRWRDAPKDYGIAKTIYNRFIRWSKLGVFDLIFSELVRRAGTLDQIMQILGFTALTLRLTERRRAF